MSTKSINKWFKNELERLSSKLKSHKPTGCGYNRLQPIVLSKSVTHMINNPLEVKESSRNASQKQVKPILNRSQYEWEDYYPVIHFQRCTIKDNQLNVENTKDNFVYYRNCSTRLT